jgi:hypothetical protein
MVSRSPGCPVSRWRLHGDYHFKRTLERNQIMKFSHWVLVTEES